MKDYEKFRSYYCGLCKSIKKNIGNLPRFTLNYDMTFLAVLLDSLSGDRTSYDRQICMAHPSKKKVVIVDNEAIKYAAYFNTILSYYKLMDNYSDDSSMKSWLLKSVLEPYMKNYPAWILAKKGEVEKKLDGLSAMEASPSGITIDEICQPFADLTGYILSEYSQENREELYWLGYNLGKWIYVIDAYDDLQKDMKEKKFNAIEAVLNKNELSYEEFNDEVGSRIDFLLTTCARQCLECLGMLPLKKNEELLHNILQYGLMEKIDKVFKRSCYDNEESL
ncbi:MAG: hypothetical protein H6Q58_1048 [Firmicutes bacterium]|nr:hypothetical protein [Bacillota bacterium]